MAVATKRSMSRTPRKRVKVKPIAKVRRSATGAVAANFYEGSRSEILADYMFSMWGTVSPVRRQSDY